MINQNVIDSIYDDNAYPVKYERILVLKNGTKLLIRPVIPHDQEMIEELHHSLDKQDTFYRFFTYVQNLRQDQIQPLVNINYCTDMVLVAEYQGTDKKQIVSMGGFFKKMDKKVGEFVFVTHKKWRALGITTCILNNLIKIAKDLNFEKLGGIICSDNKKMIKILNEFIAVIMDISD
jgi:acetyltransferase